MLYTLKFQLLYYLYESVSSLGALELLDSSLFERFKAQVIHAYRVASRTNSSGAEETVHVMESKSAKDGSANYVVLQVSCLYDAKKKGPVRGNVLYLVRDGQTVKPESLRRVPNGGEEEVSEGVFFKSAARLIQKRIWCNCLCFW